MAEVWRIEDEDADGDHYKGALDVPASSLCVGCGRCCKNAPGPTVPADLGDDIVGEIERRLRTGKWAVDWWEGERRSYFLRPATVFAQGSIFDAGYGGRCVFLDDETGCTLSREERPTVCKTLVPSLFSCETVMTKWQVVVAWRPYSALLHSIATRIDNERRADMDKDDDIPEAVEDQRLRRYGPLMMGVDMGREPAAIVVDPPYSGRQEAFHLAFLRSFAEASGQSFEDTVRAMGWDSPLDRERADRAGPGRLARARRLIKAMVRTKGRGAQNRKLKRARRLHRLVYGPHYSEIRIRSSIMMERVSAQMIQFAQQLSVSTFSIAGLDRVLRSSVIGGAGRLTPLTWYGDDLRDKPVVPTLTIKRRRELAPVRISDTFRFDVRNLGEVYRGKEKPFVSLDREGGLYGTCPECGLDYEECNRRAQLQRDGERFRRWNRQVVIPLQQEAETRRAIADALADGVIARASWIPPAVRRLDPPAELDFSPESEG